MEEQGYALGKGVLPHPPHFSPSGDLCVILVRDPVGATLVVALPVTFRSPR